MSDNESRIIRLEEQMKEARDDIRSNASSINNIKKDCVDKCSLVDQLFIKFKDLEKKFETIPKMINDTVTIMIDKSKISIIKWMVTVILGSTIATLTFWYNVNKDNEQKYNDAVVKLIDNRLTKFENKILKDKLNEN